MLDKTLEHFHCQVDVYHLLVLDLPLDSAGYKQHFLSFVLRLPTCTFLITIAHLAYLAPQLVIMLLQVLILRLEFE